MHKFFRVIGLILLFAAIGSAVFASDKHTGAQQSATLSPSARIVGGFSISIEQTPGTVALLRTSRVMLDGNLFQAQYCGGAVIASRWILTAAHCVVDTFGTPLAPESIMVVTGSADLGNPANQPISVSRVFPHPLYRSVEQGRDLALLELENATDVTPIALDVQPVKFNDQAFIAGWGALTDGYNGIGQVYPKRLQGAFVNMIPGITCAGYYAEYEGVSNIATICAGVPDGGKDSCQGDSGGPLYRVNTKQNRIMSIAGVTSWGIGCGLAEYPGIYTRVSAYTRWIQSTLGRNDAQAIIYPSNDDPIAAERQPSILPSESVDGALVSQGSGASGDDNSVDIGAVPMHGLFAMLSVLLLRLGRRR